MLSFICSCKQLETDKSGDRFNLSKDCDCVFSFVPQCFLFSSFLVIFLFANETMYGTASECFFFFPPLLLFYFNLRRYPFLLKLSSCSCLCFRSMQGQPALCSVLPAHGNFQSSDTKTRLTFSTINHH